jgi:hypothetical protein
MLIIVLFAVLAATSAHGRDLTLPDPKIRAWRR